MLYFSRGTEWAHISPFSLRPHPRNAGPSLPLHLAGGLGWGTEGTERGSFITQRQALRVGRKGGLSPPRGPPFWSLVFLFAPRGPSTWQRKGLWEGGASSCVGNLWPESERQC